MITIIVLLILAGVSIATLTGNNGLLQKSADAKNKTTEGKETEEIALSYNAVISRGKDSVTAEELQSELDILVGNGETFVNEVGDGNLNILFKNTNNSYNTNNGNIIKVKTPDPEEDLALLKQYFIGKGYSDFLEPRFDENNEWIGDYFKNNDVIPDASNSIKYIDAYRIGIEYHNRKYEMIGNGEEDDYTVTDIEDITGLTLVYGLSNNYIKFIPKTNETWYEWAIDPENINDLDIIFSNMNMGSLKSMIIYLYEEVGENTPISRSFKFADGFPPFICSLSDDQYVYYGDVFCNSIIGAGKSYYLNGIY